MLIKEIFSNRKKKNHCLHSAFHFLLNFLYAFVYYQNIYTHKDNREEDEEFVIRKYRTWR
jgi:hypothetical protein